MALGLVKVTKPDGIAYAELNVLHEATNDVPINITDLSFTWVSGGTFAITCPPTGRLAALNYNIPPWELDELLNTESGQETYYRVYVQHSVWRIGQVVTYLFPRVAGTPSFIALPLVPFGTYRIVAIKLPTALLETVPTTPELDLDNLEDADLPNLPNQDYWKKFIDVDGHRVYRWRLGPNVGIRP